MGLEKAIEHNKEHRKPFTGAKAIDSSCRNHGSCEWCAGNRLYGARKRLAAMDYDEDDYDDEWGDD